MTAVTPPHSSKHRHCPRCWSSAISWRALFHDDPHIPGELSWQGVVQVWMCDRIARTADSGDCAALSTKDRGLQEHLDLTARAAHQLSEALGLSNPLRNLLVQSRSSTTGASNGASGSARLATPTHHNRLASRPGNSVQPSHQRRLSS